MVPLALVAGMTIAIAIGYLELDRRRERAATPLSGTYLFADANAQGWSTLSPALCRTARICFLKSSQRRGERCESGHSPTSKEN